MSNENRSQYCVLYPGPEGELFIRENIGVDDLAQIFKEATASNQDDEVLAFNMRGISQFSDTINHPENSYILIVIKEGQLQIRENIRPGMERLFEGADLYYIVDDIFIVSDDALHQLIK